MQKALSGVMTGMETVVNINLNIRNVSLIELLTKKTAAAKPVWANELVSTASTATKNVSLLLLASTSSNVILVRGSMSKINKCLGISNAFTSAALV